jgi:hypothetical protein
VILTGNYTPLMPMHQLQGPVHLLRDRFFLKAATFALLQKQFLTSQPQAGFYMVPCLPILCHLAVDFNKSTSSHLQCSAEAPLPTDGSHQCDKSGHPME